MNLPNPMDIIEFPNGAYLKIGWRWYRIERLAGPEEEEARQMVRDRDDEALRQLGLTPKKRD